MGAIEVIDIAREATWIMLKIAAPGMAAALAIGLTISILQALTQIQEATLAFVPKLVGVFVAIVATLPWVISVLQSFTEGLYGRIANIAPV